MIDNYDNFILESKIFNFLNEGILNYSTDLRDALKFIDNDKVAKILLKNSNRISNSLPISYIDLKSDNLLSFIQNNKLRDNNVYYKLNELKLNFINPGSIMAKKIFELDPNLKSDNIYDPFESDIIVDNKYRIVGSTIFKDYDGEYTIYKIQSVNNEDVFRLVYSLNGEEDVLIPIDINYDNLSKSDIRIGRFVNIVCNTFGYSISESDIEVFINKINASVEFLKNSYNNIKVVSGEDIRKYYLNTNYNKSNESSTLWKSCMSYDYCQSYLDIYVNNPNIIKLVVLLDNSGLVLSRALLWKLSNGDTYLDRVYYISEKYKELFERWADDKGYLYYGVDELLTVKITSISYDEYPYMDTFTYYNPGTGILSNEFSSYCIILHETDGGWI